MERETRGADELAVLLLSFGTTSMPKGIVHSSNTLRYASQQICERWQLTAEDKNLIVCEWGFVGSLVFGYLVTLLSGATGVLLARWSAGSRCARSSGIGAPTFSTCPPTAPTSSVPDARPHTTARVSARSWPPVSLGSAGSRCRRCSRARRLPITGSRRSPATSPTGCRSHRTRRSRPRDFRSARHRGPDPRSRRRAGAVG